MIVNDECKRVAYVVASSIEEAELFFSETAYSLDVEDARRILTIANDGGDSNSIIYTVTIEKFKG